MKLPLSFALQLEQLHAGTEVGWGTFRGTSRSLLDQFIADGVLDFRPTGRQQKLVYCKDPNNLVLYLHHKFEIPSLREYIIFLQKEDTERSDAVRAASDSKIKKIKVMDGFLINCYDDIHATLNNHDIVLRPLDGSYIFIHSYRNFIVSPEVTVVGVEGYENFKNIERQRYLFKSIRPLFVWRYQNSTSIASWLSQIQNPYIHFGDFDPKGLHIYISEFRNKINFSRCNFLIPPDIKALISRYGERKLYDDQMEYLKGFNFDIYPEIKEIFFIIKELQKGLAQEVLINPKF